MKKYKRFISIFLIFMIILSSVAYADTTSTEPISGAVVVSQNIAWGNKTVYGDLYIGPKAVFTVLGNVTVTGNVYVLGALKSNGGLSINGTLYGREMIWGADSTLYNGTVVMKGTNNLTSIAMSNYPVKDIPLRIDNQPLKIVDGYLDMDGATLNIADVYVNGTKQTLDDTGIIAVRNLFVGNVQKITIKFVTVFGNSIIKEFEAKKYTKLESGELNGLPVISGAENKTIKVGDAFDSLSGITAYDEEDGDITSKLQVAGDVDTLKEGQYEITYSVTDSSGSTTTASRIITVRTNEKPVISGIEDKTIKRRIEFNPLDGVTAYDKEDGDITSKIQVSGNVNTFELGKYTLSYSVTDMDGNTTVKERVITVRSNEIPSLSMNGTEIVQGMDFDPFEDVHMWDYEDGEITDKAEASGTVDTTKPGEYIIKYSVTDSDGNFVQYPITYTVIKSDWYNHWGRDYIKSAMENDIVDLSANFRPEDPVTRAEFIKLVNRTFGFTEAGSISYTDVKPEFWYYYDVQIAAKAGYISTANKTFRPNDPISREEVAVIICNLLNCRDDNLDKLQGYTDMSKVSSWARSSVEGAIEAGYMGQGSLEFRPLDRMVRAEAVTALSRIK